MIWNCQGSYNQVWPAAMERIRSDAVLAEAGTRSMVTMLSSTGTSCELWTHAVHTGHAAGFLIAIENRDSSSAAAVFIQECQWDVKSVMIEADRLVRHLFQGTSFRLRRSILMDIGKMSHKVLNELNESLRIEVMSSQDMTVTMQMDSYGAFLDVEWIEDCMGGDQNIIDMMNRPG